MAGPGPATSRPGGGVTGSARSLNGGGGRRRRFGLAGAVVMLSMLVGIGCVSLSMLANRAARVFVVASETRSFDREVLFDQRTIEAMRVLAADEGDELLAVLKLPEGLHPYSVFAFVERQDEIELVVTTISWGTVLAKWRGTVSGEELVALAERAAAGTFRCRAGGAAGDVLAVAPLFVRWSDDGQATCVGDWFAEGDEELLELVDELLASARQTYEHPGLAARKKG